MTGMPASLAFSSAGRIALVSWASRIRTLAPFEIRVSTSVSCCSVLRLASASMYGAAAGLDGLLDVGLVVGRPARLLEVVPGDADGAAGRGRGRSARRRWRPACACSAPQAATADGGGGREDAQPSNEHARALPPPNDDGHRLAMRYVRLRRLHR